MSPSKFLKKRSRQTKPPIAERRHWREELRIQARHVRAGDALIMRKGRTKRFLPINEIHQNGNEVWIKYKDLKLPGAFGAETYKAKEMVEVRRTFHD